MRRTSCRFFISIVLLLVTVTAVHHSQHSVPATQTMHLSEQDQQHESDIRTRFAQLIEANRANQKDVVTALQLQKHHEQRIQHSLEQKAAQVVEREKFLQKMEFCMQAEPESFLQTGAGVVPDEVPVPQPVPVAIIEDTSEVMEVAPEPECSSKQILQMYRSKIHSFDNLGRCEMHPNCGTCVGQIDCGWCPTSGQCIELNDHAECSENLQLIGGQCPVEIDQPELPEDKVSTFFHCRITSRIRVLTLNVGDSEFEAWAPLLKVLIESRADIIALQEVSDRFFHTLQQQPFFAKYFRSQFSRDHAPGGLHIMSKFPILNFAYYERVEPGQTKVDMRGRMLLVDVQTSTVDRLTVATTMLDWPDARNRASNLDFIFEVLRSHTNVLLLGDFNFDENAQPETSHIPSNFVDAWNALNSSNSLDAGHSWNPFAFISFAIF